MGHWIEYFLRPHEHHGGKLGPCFIKAVYCVLRPGGLSFVFGACHMGCAYKTLRKRYLLRIYHFHDLDRVGIGGAFVGSVTEILQAVLITAPILIYFYK